MNCSALPDYCCSGAYYPSNPDVTGIGVRVSIYVTSILGFIMSLLVEEEEELQRFRESLRSSYVLALSTVIAALWARYQSDVGLSLLDGQVVTMLVGIITTAYAGPAVYMPGGLGPTARLSQILFNLLYPIFGFILYADPEHFGGAAYLPECQPNSAFVFVLFGHSISATSNYLRGWAIFAYVVALLFGLGSLVRDYMSLSDGDDNQAVVSPGTLVLSCIMNPAIIIYLIATTEELIARNTIYRQTVAEQWTFGQTLAMVVLLDQVLKIGSWLVQAGRG